jgi:GNAT superfamily N-acetyltransferase
LKFLIDTNVLISLEPVATELEPRAELAAEFLALAHEGGHPVVRHPAQRVDDANDRNEARRRARAVLFRKYPTISRVRAMRADFESALGDPPHGSHDWVDNELLGAVEAHAVDFLVTEDGGIHRKAKRVNLAARVLLVRDALDMLRTFLDRPPAAPPAVEWTKATELDERDPIFESVRVDYPELDVWLEQCRLESRDVALIRSRLGGYAGVCILARKADKFGATGKFLKICQFKVSDRFRGRRYGELLLKTVFDYRRDNSYDFAYVTVHERHDGLVRLFEDFGFDSWVERTPRGELVLVKSFRPAEQDRLTLDPLAFHRKFGPPAVMPRPEQTFAVPIRPEYHRLLFPEAEPQLGLGLEDADRPYGNALRKAYLSLSRIRLMPAGSTLLFYRSGDAHAITSVGVLESATREEDAEAIARLVGKRTVYSLEEIIELAHKPVLALLFRQDRLLKRPITLAEAIRWQLLSAAPQSIAAIRPEGFEWMTRRIDE